MQTRTVTGFLVAAVLVGTVAGCSSSTRSSQPSTPAAHEAASPSTAVAGPSTTVASIWGTAADEVELFRRLGLPVTHVVVYTAATDPNNRLGRPGQYLSAAHWQDPRVRDQDPTDTDGGGTVEVFADPARAQARAAYIQSIKTGGLLGTEYDYLNGAILVRISGVLTPGQAGAYGNASGGTLYQP